VPTAIAGPETAQGPSAAAIFATERRSGDYKAEPQAGQSEKFAERAEHNDIPAGHIRRETQSRPGDVHERFVDHEQAAAPAKIGGQREQIAARKKPAVRIVRVGGDHERGIAAIVQAGHRFDFMSGKRGRATVGSTICVPGTGTTWASEGAP